MITRIQIENFKSIRKADVKLGKLNVFFGLNASGKSNFFEALKVYKQLTDGLTVNEVLNGESERASVKVTGIRGGAKAVLPFGEQRNQVDTFSFDVEAENKRHFLRVNPSRGEIIDEQPRYRNEEAHQLPRTISFNQGPEFVFSTYKLFTYDFDVAQLRKYTRISSGHIPLAEDGNGFASVIYYILDQFYHNNENKSNSFRYWLKDTISENIQDVFTRYGADGDVLFGVVENGAETMAPSLSDGTLRYAAILSSLLQPAPPKYMAYEEPETGLHPSRIRTLVKLFEQSIEWNDSQLFISTHSPLFLAWLDKKFHINTFVCYKNDEGETQIKPVTEFENFEELVKKYSFGDMMTENWFEFNT